MSITKKASEILLLVGITISAYLVVEHYNPTILSCLHNSVINCSNVLTSQYSMIFGISLSLIVLIWTVGMFVLMLKKKNKISKLIYPIWQIMGIIGVAYSIISQYLIGYICIYCTILDSIILIIVITDLTIHNGKSSTR